MGDTAILIVAAGRGRRAGGGLPKQWRKIAGRRVIDWTLDAFAQFPRIVVVLNQDDMLFAQDFDKKGISVITGGETRVVSVRNGLEFLAKDPPDHVLIHDAARPFISQSVISAVSEALDTNCGAAPALPIVDALWRGTNSFVAGTQDRTELYRAQTPQGFQFNAILAAHRAAKAGALDDVEVARAAGIDVAIVKGEEQNFKITTPQDFEKAASMLQEDKMDIRTGNGFDVHRFGPGDHVVLCGVKIPYSRGLQGHSDADVGMHTVTDAIYGALAMGDIGQHFPPSDQQWKGADSAVFLRHACALAREHGFKITHTDCTLICEYPKIGPHAQSMRARMAEIMEMEVSRVSVKATTSEKLGFTGRSEGIACMATATLVKI